MGYNTAPFEAAELSFTQELLMEVLPHFNKYKNQSIKDSFYFGLCDFLEENPTHWIYNAMKDITTDPYEILTMWSSNLETEYREYISTKKDKRHRGGKLPKFQTMMWDSVREFVNEKGVKIRYSQDGSKISLKAFTTGMVANLSDFDSLMTSLHLEYKDITIPKFFRLVSYFHLSRGKDAVQSAQTYFKKFPSLMVFNESMFVELGLEDKKSEDSNLDEVDFLIL
jgi:hypothetical protein